MGRSGKISRLERKTEPTPRPIGLPAAAEEDTPVAETRPSTAAIPKSKKRTSQASSSKNKKNRDKAVKGVEFAERLQAKADLKQQKKAKKESAKRLWE